MIDRVHRATLFALYQLSIALGIVMLPIALVTNRVGLPLPVHRLVDGLGSRYEAACAR
ncbi:hypothetical protein [Salinarchaeum laminariae]|uniref:hypothetical protein n=1 Tax=Salinarchaeum laminariae TaxID=869888 RepID=UPI0020BDEFB1|nr:hypothetical protein [Salinarchaeum laminariae]